jgi:hypothetical protein
VEVSCRDHFTVKSAEVGRLDRPSGPGTNESPRPYVPSPSSQLPLHSRSAGPRRRRGHRREYPRRNLPRRQLRAVGASAWSWGMAGASRQSTRCLVIGRGVSHILCCRTRHNVTHLMLSDHTQENEKQPHRERRANVCTRGPKWCKCVAGCGTWCCVWL